MLRGIPALAGVCTMLRRDSGQVLLTRRIQEHRSAVILVLIVGTSLFSLASGARGGVVAEFVGSGIDLASLPFVQGLNAARGGVTYLSGLVFDYNAEREEARALRHEITELMQRTTNRQEVLSENKRLRAMMDFQRNQPLLTLWPAEIIQNYEGVLTIDLGSIHGIQSSMCVLSKEGIVGIVTKVDPMTAHVVTLQNPDCRVDAMIAWNRVRGKVRGTGNDLNPVCSMEYISLNEHVRSGDVVVASPESVFPSGYPIGRIQRVQRREGSLFQSADILPSADPFRLDEVFVLIKANPKADDLAGQVAVVPQDRTGAFLDTMSIQERFAP
jgi:rod shape-determining protein MreC